jgi:hypothetical protein
MCKKTTHKRYSPRFNKAHNVCHITPKAKAATKSYCQAGQPVSCPGRQAVSGVETLLE